MVDARRWAGARGKARVAPEKMNSSHPWKLLVGKEEEN
jgi:hypothetical protein